MRPRIVPAVAVVLLAVAWGARARTYPSACSLGHPQRQVPLLRPQPGSFHSVDALNPDVVAWHGQYLMYFSANDVMSTTAPDWTTGLAVASKPMGPFHVTRWRAPYLNGGTTVWRGRLWHLVEMANGTNGSAGNELAVSRDGRRWRHVAWLPMFRLHGQVVVGADFSLSVLRHQLAVFMFLVRAYPLGTTRTLGSLLFDGHRFHDFKPLFATAAPFDLGEPDVFIRGGHWTMVYVQTAADDVRSIHMATFAHGRWTPCRHTAAVEPGASWAPVTAIDPSVTQGSGKTYLYYGGGRNRGLGSDLGGAIGVAEFDAAG